MNNLIKSLWWTDVACVREIGSLWIILFFIVTWLMPFGLLFSVVLLCLGLGLDMWSICMFVGGPLVICEMLLCGRWCLRAFYGVYKG